MAEEKGALYERELKNYGTEDEDSVNLLTNGEQDINKPQKDKRSVYDKQSLGSWCSTNYKLLLVGLGVVTLIILGVVVGAVSNKVANLGRPPRSVFPYPNLRLPNEVVPLRYRIYLHPNLTTFNVNGRVRILVNCVTETNRIILHSKSNQIDAVNVLKGDFLNTKSGTVKSEDVIQSDKPMTHKKHELLLIPLNSKLKPGANYTVIIRFNGSLADGLEGFYKSRYKTKSGETRYIATTHFESTAARAAFPCFDEPALKAKFQIIIVREQRHVALSNMPVSYNVTRNDGLVVDHFQESVKMSTYLVAFVICDFKHKEAKSKRGIMLVPYEDLEALEKLWSFHTALSSSGCMKDLGLRNPGTCLLAVTLTFWEIRVWAPADQIEQAEFAIKAAPIVLDYYEEFFKVNFPLPKQDLIAIPDFAAGAMENWGLITYRLTSLLYDRNQSSEANKQWVAVVIAHEMAHQWFGNLVTMKWWNDLWLNEGFAAYVEFIGAGKVGPTWHMMDQFIVDDTQLSLTLDSHANSHPISAEVKDPSQINSIFDSISYDKEESCCCHGEPTCIARVSTHLNEGSVGRVAQLDLVFGLQFKMTGGWHTRVRACSLTKPVIKGASIIRMMRNFIGTNAFHTGLQNYLQKYKFSNAETDDLWAELTKANGKIDVKAVMDTWTRQMGYPVVTVQRDASGNAYATQKHFLIDPTAKPSKPSPFDYKWDVPFTFKTEKGKGTKRTSLDIVWMNRTNDKTTFDWPQSDGWIKANTDSLGFYRVNYDEANWLALTKQLNTDHKVLSQSDRSNIIDDAFELARADQLNQTIGLELTKYLDKEEDYVPWYTVLSSLAFISEVLEHRPGYKYYEKYLLQKIQPQVKRLGWKDEGTHLHKYLRSAILKTAVAHNDTTAVEEARKLFNDYKTKNISVSPNLKGVVYLAGIKYGNESDWDFMWNQFKTTMVPTEQKKIMFSLCDSKDPKILQRFFERTVSHGEVRVSHGEGSFKEPIHKQFYSKYLEWSLDSTKIRSQDSVSVIQYIAVNKEGQQLAWDFVRKNWDILFKRYGTGSFDMTHLIKSVCGRFVTKEKLKEVEDFFKTHKAGSGTRAVSQAIENIKNHISWLAKHETEVVNWFKSHVV